MLRISCVVAAACMAAFASFAVNAEEKSEQEQLKQELELLKRKVDALETAPSTAPKSQTANAFNPAISLILGGQAAYFSDDPEDYSLPGFSPGEEAGPGEQGFSLGESEMTVSANVDNLFYGQFTLALTPENEAEVEEAYIEARTLPAGFTARFGRLKSGIGYLNSQHSHVWDFVDAPLVYRALFGNQFADDGLRITWLAPTDFFLEIGAEVFRGENMPAGGASKRGAGAYTLYGHIGGDIGTSHSWQAGLSHLAADADARESGELSFSGDSSVNIADLVWKWAPNGNPYQQNLKLQMEYLWGDESGNYDGIGDIDIDRDGWYVQAIYQFVHRWRVGLRYGEVSSDDPGTDFAATELATGDDNPRRASLMVDFSNSEFSRLRLQINRDESSPDDSEAVILQYIMAIGAHGAHQF